MGWVGANAEKVKALAANVARVHCQQLVGERPGLPITSEAHHDE